MMPRMLSGHLQGRFLAMMSQMIQPKSILEIGTYTGYSAICLAEGLQQGGTLHTIDINEELETLVRKYFENAGIANQVHYHIGNAIDIIPTIEGTFDLVFIDADKINYANYYDLVIDRVAKGGYIMADNVLWSGKVIEDKKDKDTAAIDAYNKKLMADTRVETVLVPIRDGILIARKTV
jgi:predicted O-methyltransferase YrrM